MLDGERHVAQLSLDAVRAVVGQRPALYYELEVELAPDGTEADLARLAGELAAAWKLAPEPRSKFARALATSHSTIQSPAQPLLPGEPTNITPLVILPRTCC